MTRSILTVFLALAALPSLGQPRAFNCIGAERLEDDVFTIPFAPGRSGVTDAARSLLAAAAELATADTDRNVCVLGHAGAEGGAQTTTTLAAARAREVARVLAERGIARERIRAEARGANFSPAARADIPRTRSVSIVVLPGARERGPEPSRERTPEPVRERAPEPATTPAPAAEPGARDAAPQSTTPDRRPE
ncbi:OmpA family protein [Plastoroseomonas arctica]|uniref:OmpA family protein n=1 Tax=Plastoroseomonas arctica TaxID=1509237 RepID=A0AAF1KUK9_9PROT|nr:OmpA family protein [Plastoroseomonas arctica]MBR0656367.1 OmpA family protein [Plastoroseomonas arctica]